MCPGPSIITCTSCSQAFFVNSPSTFNSANCASSLASAMHPGLKPSPNEKLTSCFLKILQIFSMFSYKKFCFLWCSIQCAISEPPRLTIPVIRFRTNGTCSRSTPARRFAAHHLGVQFLALGDVLHLLRNHAQPRQMHLRHVPAAIRVRLRRFPLLHPAIAHRHKSP